MGLQSKLNDAISVSPIKKAIKKLPVVKTIYEKLNNQYAQEEFVRAHLSKVKAGAILLDAGCGHQRYRVFCDHLIYKAQDFGEYTTDAKRTLGMDGVGGLSGYGYGKLDYVGNIWEIDEEPNTFDVIRAGRENLDSGLSDDATLN